MVRSRKQSICSTRSFGEAVTDRDVLEEVVACLVTVFACTSPFDEPSERYWGTRTVSLPVPTEDTIILVTAAVAFLGDIFRPGFRYKKKLT